MVAGSKEPDDVQRLDNTTAAVNTDFAPCFFTIYQRRLQDSRLRTSCRYSEESFSDFAAAFTAEQRSWLEAIIAIRNIRYHSWPDDLCSGIRIAYRSLQLKQECKLLFMLSIRVLYHLIGLLETDFLSSPKRSQFLEKAQPLLLLLRNERSTKESICLLPRLQGVDPAVLGIF